MLVIADAGLTTDPEERFGFFLGKLKSYVGAILAGVLEEDFPNVKLSDYTIELQYQTEPTEAMRQVTHVTPRGDKNNMIPIVFQPYGSDSNRAAL